MFEKSRIARLTRAVDACRPDPAAFPDDPWGIATLREALGAVESGNYGVGAVLVNAAGEIVARGHNRVYHDGFHSEAHAEMVVISDFERRSPGPGRLVDHILITSLEPCPMCLGRLKLCGVGQVRYLAPDPDGGMVHRMDALPPIWALLNPQQRFEPADVSPRVRELGWEIFECNVRQMRRKLVR